MSVVIAIKDTDNNRFILGCDSQVSAGNLKSALSENSTKIWTVGGYDNILMGGVGYLRNSQIIQTQLAIDSEIVENQLIDFEWIVKNLIPNIFTLLRNQKRLITDKDGGLEIMENKFIFICNNLGFVIGHDGSVIEIADYAAIGSGDEVAIGSLENSKGNLPKDRIEKAIHACAERTLYVNNEVLLLESGPNKEELADLTILKKVFYNWDCVPDDLKEQLDKIIDEKMSLEKEEGKKGAAGNAEAEENNTEEEIC